MPVGVANIMSINLHIHNNSLVNSFIYVAPVLEF